MKRKYTLLFIPFLMFLIMCGNQGGSVDQKDVQVNAPDTEKSGGLRWPPEHLVDGTEVDLKKTGLKNYYIIFDGSGSMAGEKLEIAKKALIRFVKVIPENGNIGLTSFDSSGFFERSPLGSSRAEILGQVEKIKAGGNTPLGGCIDIAYEKLGTQAARQMGYGEYNLIIITDGEATDGGRMSAAVDRIIRETPIVIHTIGLRIGTGHALNQPGKVYYKPADNYDELAKGLEGVLAETQDFIVTDFKK